MSGRRWVGILLAAALLAGCGSQAAPAAKPAASAAKPAAPAAATPSKPAPQSKLLKVTLRLPWLVGGYDDGFIMAAAKGYYKQQGFDVTIAEGKGSQVTAQQIGNGIDMFGISDAGTVATLISKGVPIKVLGVYVQGSPMSFVYDKQYPFNTPKDLLGGRQVFSSAGDADLTIVPAVLAKYGMTKSQLHLTLIQPSSYASVLATHPKGVVLAYADSDYLRIHQVAPNAVYKRYAKFGVNLYNVGLIASDQTIKQHPNEVRRFLKATTQGWQYADKHPNQAVAADHAMFPQAKAAVEKAGLLMAIKWQHTPATQGHTIGWMAQSDWQQTVGLLHKYAGLKKVLPIVDYYTNAFLPKS